MKYSLYLCLHSPDGNTIKIGKTHEISWDTRDLIRESSGWLIMNREHSGEAAELIPKLHKGIFELKNSADSYLSYELSHGFGTIKKITAFYEALLQDCQQYPYAELCGEVAG